VAGWLADGCVVAGSLAGAAAGCDAACSWSVDFLHPENSNPAESNVVTRKSLLRLIKTFLPDNGFLNQTSHRRLPPFASICTANWRSGLLAGRTKFRNKGLPLSSLLVIWVDSFGICQGMVTLNVLDGTLSAPDASTLFMAYL
jgi:hypothetical protein